MAAVITRRAVLQGAAAVAATALPAVAPVSASIPVALLPGEYTFDGGLSWWALSFQPKAPYIWRRDANVDIFDPEDDMGNPEQPRDYHGRFTHGLFDSLKDRLITQKGHPPDKAHELAMEILQEQESIDANGNLTAKGLERERLGREGRAKDRLAKQTGHNPEHLVYDKRLGKAFVK